MLESSATKTAQTVARRAAGRKAMIVRATRREVLRYGSAGGCGGSAVACLGRGIVAQQADPHHLRLPGRWPDRHLRARLWRVYRAEDGTAGIRREQGGRQRRHCGRAGEECRARRLHADVDDLDHDDHEQGAVQEAALRSGQGLRADLVDERGPPADHRQQERAGQEPRGVRRLCAQPQGLARHLRHRLVQPCRGRGAEPPLRARRWRPCTIAARR